MKAEIISIGDELLIGQVVNTNASWMAVELNLAGINVVQISSVSDEGEHIQNALQEAETRADVVLLTGGLGPTKDDITKKVMMDYFGSKPKFHEPTYQHIKNLFSKRSYPLSEVNRLQAYLPDNCTILPNRVGTAAGMWFEKNDTIFVSMPGVPFEMKTLIWEQVIPNLKKRFKTPFIYHKTIMTTGIGESMLAEKIEKWESGLPDNIKLAYLPQPGIVRLRLSAEGFDEDKTKTQVDEQCELLKNYVPKAIFGYNDISLEETLANILKEKGLTLATAESCTGGYISHLITSIAGSSEFFMGSVVSYSNEAKMNLLSVNKNVIENYGAVSKEVVEKMAVGAREKFNTDYAISTSGIAGPDGGTEEKPVGTVWIGIATKKGVQSKLFHFGEHRGRNIRRSALMALNLLRLEVLGL
ncbi:MAG: competence/damage-inducible protein A [Marinilabiliales bacterium]|nr:MAG: competence/damage-inducible protein A [Marinilabiliales bacterium]